MTIKKVSVIGSGAWGTTLAMMINNNGYQTSIWTHSSELKEEIDSTGINKFCFNMKVPEDIKICDEFNADFFDCDLIVLVIASSFCRQTAKIISQYIKPDTLILSATKGMEDKTAKMPYDILKEELPKEMHKNICILSGPNIAKEIAENKPAATIIAGDSGVTPIIQEVISNNNFRAYTSTDVKGVELGGILKNIIAIAAGACDGLGLGTNSKSALMTRGIYEIAKIGKIFGADISTFQGLSGIGDLITTCTSPLSRNYRVGKMLAEGKKIEDIKQSLGAVAEGVRSCKIIYELANKNNVEVPICEQVYKIIYEDLVVKDAINNLMTRSLKVEYGI